MDPPNQRLPPIHGRKLARATNILPHTSTIYLLIRLKIIMAYFRPKIEAFEGGFIFIVITLVATLWIFIYILRKSRLYIEYPYSTYTKVLYCTDQSHELIYGHQNPQREVGHPEYSPCVKERWWQTAPQGTPLVAPTGQVKDGLKSALTLAPYMPVESQPSQKVYTSQALIIFSEVQRKEII